MAKQTFITKKITNEDIYDMLKKQGKVQIETLEHAKVTNGNVANNLKSIQSLEGKSMGVWIHKNPFKFTSLAVAFFAVMMLDLPQPLFAIVKSLF